MNKYNVILWIKNINKALLNKMKKIKYILKSFKDLL